MDKKITVIKFKYEGNICLLPVLDSIYNVNGKTTSKIIDAVKGNPEFNSEGYLPIHFVVKNKDEFTDFCSSFFKELEHRKIKFIDVILEEADLFDVINSPFSDEEIIISKQTHTKFPMIITNPDGVEEIQLPILNIKF